MKILLAAVNAKYTHMNPALYSIRAFAGEYGRSMEIAEYTINQYPKDVLKDIYSRHPDIIGLSCYIWNMRFIGELLEDLGKILPDTAVLLGGPEASNNSDELLEKYSCVDGIFLGEGEYAWRELAMRFSEDPGKEGKDPEDIADIPGLKVRNEDHSAVPGKMADLDDIPFIFSDPGRFNNRMIYYESSRGCPFRCSYCLSSLDKSMRLKSLEKVLPELQLLLDSNVRIVKFTDRTFNADHDHAMGIWRYLAEHDNGITRFHFEIEAELLAEEELDFLCSVRTGLFQLEIGVQSVNPETLRAVNRNSDITRIRQAVKKLAGAGQIPVHVDLIAGLPFEDIESFRNSFNEVYSWGADELQLGFLKVLHGTEIERKAGEYGLVYESSQPYEVLSTSWLSFDDIICLKDIEEQLERYGNSGAFKYTIREFENYFSDAFSMYEYIAEYFRKNNGRFRKQSRIGAYEMLREIIGQKLEELHGAFEGFDLGMKGLEHFDALMLIDLYSKEKLKSRPDFLPGADEQRKQEKEYKRAMNITENVHVEFFPFDVQSLLDGDIEDQRPGRVIFTYDGQGAAVKIETEDENGNRMQLKRSAAYDII